MGESLGFLSSLFLPRRGNFSADVNGDDLVTPVDALEVINFIRRQGSSIEVTGSERIDGFYDVSQDRRVSPIEALTVINEIRRNRNVPDTEAGTSVNSDFLDALDERAAKRTNAQSLDSAIEDLSSESGGLF